MSESNSSLSAVLESVLDGLGDVVRGYHSQHGDDTILIDAQKRLEVASWLLDHEALHFDMLIDSTVVDWDEEEPRFEVVDHFFSTDKHHRLRLKCRVTEDAPKLPSLASLYGSALWMERESYDMYGVIFEGHPDLRRVLLYPEFQGFPLRKDYDKLQSWPLFERRYEGTRMDDERTIHRRVGDDEQQWLRDVVAEDPSR